MRDHLAPVTIFAEAESTRERKKTRKKKNKGRGGRGRQKIRAKDDYVLNKPA
jgi:hypothetical protein